MDLTKIKCAHDELLELHKIIENPKNPNRHPDNQIDLLAKIIDFQGQRSPIIISNRSGFITKGHGRLMAIKKLGWERAAVDFQDYQSEAEEYADMVADNKIAELAETDMASVIDELNNLDFNLDFDLLGIPDFKLPEAEEVPLPDLSSGDPGIQTMTFVVSNEQKDIIDEAIAKAKKSELCEDGLNENSNGNALAAIMKRYIYG